MSEEAKPPEGAPAEPPAQAPKLPILDVYVNSLHVSDRIALAALITAVVATFIGVAQTAFMWAARNDEVEATLRAEQLRSCVKYRNAGFAANTRAQQLALDGVPPDGDEEFESRFANYNAAIGELMYLLPTSNGDALEQVEQSSLEVYFAYEDREPARLQELTLSETQDLPWSNSHNLVLDACEAIIRDVRDH